LVFDFSGCIPADGEGGVPAQHQVGGLLLAAARLPRAEHQQALATP
jgi:hypothetical protein